MSELQHELHPQRPTPLDPSLPTDANGTDAGLPPTPPTMSQDGQATQTAESSPGSDALVKSLVSKHSSLSTPVNARSPPTPDPSPPRTNDSKSVTTPLLERPPMVAYPSSRAESFQTAREDPLSSEPSESRSATPLVDRLSTVNEDRGLGLAFERDDNDVTPTDIPQTVYPAKKEDLDDSQVTPGAQEADKEPRIMDDIPNREWDTNLMRNVTVRRKRNPRSTPRRASEKPQIQDKETADAAPAVAVVETASPCPSPRPRRTSSLRERVVASNNSPVTPSIENFAQSIGWPTEGKATPEEKDRVASDKRNSTSSMGSTVVEAKIIVTPPRRRQTLRHSGKNMAYKRDDGSPTPDRSSRSHSVRNSLQSEDVPLHRLVHKRVSIADRTRRTSTESDAPGSVVGSYIGSYVGSDRYFSTPVSSRSMRQRTIDSSAATLRHQESIRNVLQPAADILSRSNTITRNRPHRFDQSPDLRISSAPEAAREAAPSAASRRTPGIPSSTPVSQNRPTNVAFRSPIVEQLSPVQSPVQSPVPSMESPRLRKRQQRVAVTQAAQPANVNKSLPDLPQDDVPPAVVEPPVADQAGTVKSSDDKPPPAALMERVRQLVAEREAKDQVQNTPEVKESPSIPVSPPQTKPKTLSPFQNTSSPGSGGSPSSKVQPRERRGSSMSQDRIPWSPATQHSSIEDIYRRSSEWRRPSLDHGRVSFDRSTIRTEEHAMARHLYAQTTPFSQFSDTPIEVSEATAVSIYPHNNHSLLVVQQVPRAMSMAPEPYQLEAGVHLSPNDERALQSTPTPPFVDASEGHDMEQVPTNPTVQVEPSTPPMQLLPPQPAAVDSPLKNPRPPPEPPKIMFIPPTPAEELEKQLVPGPPKRSDSHPQRRLSLVQKARRYSDNLLPTLLGRSASARGRYTSDSQSQRSDGKPKVPSVNDEDGTLHPFWRPRGFWDGFEDSESDSDDEGLPRGGDTSDVEPEPEGRPRRTNTLGRRLTSGFRGSGGFLIGNSLGVERHGTNKRRHHITLPPNFPRMPRTSSHSSPPKVIIQAPTAPLGPHKSGITKRGSRSSLRAGVYEIPTQRKSWREGRTIPGLKKYQVQYIGFSGVKDRFRERGQEKRRDKIRKSIGMRYYVEPTTPGTAGESSSSATAAASSSAAQKA